MEPRGVGRGLGFDLLWWKRMCAVQMLGGESAAGGAVLTQRERFGRAVGVGLAAPRFPPLSGIERAARSRNRPCWLSAIGVAVRRHDSVRSLRPASSLLRPAPADGGGWRGARGAKSASAWHTPFWRLTPSRCSVGRIGMARFTLKEGTRWCAAFGRGGRSLERGVQT